MKKKALFIILVVVLLVLGSVIFAKKYETMLNDGKKRNEEIGKAIEPADETNVSEDNDADKDDSKEDNDASDNPQSVTREINFESIFHCSDQYNSVFSGNSTDAYFKIDRDRDDNSIAYLQFKGPNYDRMRMYGGYDLESHNYAVTMGLGCIAWDVGYEPGLDSGTAGERLRGYLEGLGLQNQIDEYSGIYGSSIWNIEFSPLTDVAQARCTRNKGFTVCHIQAAGTGESTITYDIQ